MKRRQIRTAKRMKKEIFKKCTEEILDIYYSTEKIYENNFFGNFFRKEEKLCQYSCV